MHRLVHGQHSLTERCARRHVERQCDGGKLPLVIHRENGIGRLISCHGTQRHLRAVRRADVNIVERRGVLPILRRHLHHHMVLIERRIHNRDLPLAEGIVQRVVDQLRTQAEP